MRKGKRVEGECALEVWTVTEAHSPQNTATPGSRNGPRLVCHVCESLVSGYIDHNTEYTAGVVLCELCVCV